jgi:hypothetical protein
VLGDNLDAVLHDDSIIKLMLLTLVTEGRLKGFSKVLTPHEADKRILELEQYLLEDVDGIKYLMGELNFDKCMDFLKLVPEERLQAAHFELMLSLIAAKKRSKKFYEGRKPNYDDVAVIVERIKWLMKGE